MASLAVATTVVTAGALGAQPTPRRQANRAELEAAAARAEQSARVAKDGKLRAKYAEQAAKIRARLKEGDFQPGHRILLSVYGDSTLTDTFTVRADRNLLLPNLPPISLVGVLDSELQPYLQTELSKYLKNPTITAQGLLRLSILGAVGQPGFYSFPMDFLVTDAVMEAGGPADDAKMDRVEIRRGGSVVVDKGGMQDAFRLGLTLNDIGARPGDELVVPSDRKSHWQTIVTGIGLVSGLAWSISLLAK